MLAGGRVRSFLAGESLRSLALSLEDEGIKTVAGGTWRTPTLRGMLSSPRIAGLRQHRGQTIGRAVWKPIISAADHGRVLARLEALRASGRRSPRRYLLSGLLRCGRCGHVLFSAARRSTRRYVCMSGPDHGGCGRLTVVADSLEQLIADAVVLRLDSADLAAALSGRAGGDAETAMLAEQISEDRAQLEELAGMYGNKKIGPAEWMEARNPIEDRIRDAERRLARMTNTTAVQDLVGNGDALRGSWSTLNLDRQHAIVRTLLDHAVVLPGTPGAQVLDPNRVEPVWRL